MFKMIVFLLAALVLEAIGVVLLNKGLRQIGEISWLNPSELIRAIRLGITNPYLLIGIFFEALFFAGLLVLLSKADVSFVWPLTSLGFVITTLAARVYLHETVSASRWAGVLMIVLGAGLVSWSENQKEKTAAPTSNHQTVSSIAPGASDAKP
jgi:drug/metabolite transporter (DMT)-like permease